MAKKTKVNLQRSDDFFAVDAELTVMGAGYGNALTSGGVEPQVSSTATVLRSSAGAGAIFEVSEDLTLKNVRLEGGTIAQVATVEPFVG